MQHLKQAGRAYWAAAALLALCMSGCGSGIASNASPDTPAVQPGTQSYFAPAIDAANNIETYALNDSDKTFTQTSYGITPPQQGPQVLTAGKWTASSRGLLTLETTATYTSTPNGQTTNTFVGTSYDPPIPGGYAVELAGQAGGLIQLTDQLVVPMVAATECPNLTNAQTWQYVTIPGAFQSNGDVDLSTLNPAGNIGYSHNLETWDPVRDTAYGSIDISSNGSNITFSNPHQFVLSPVGGVEMPPLWPASSSQTGACSPTFYGNTISLPNPLIVKNPGASTAITPPLATIGIGPTGLLVEDNGSRGGSAANVLPDLYVSTLGAGSGAIGLPKPSSALDVNALRSAQYLGFVLGAGAFTNIDHASGNSSHLVSFGFSSTPANCGTSVAPSTPTMIYGSDLSQGDPSTSSDGFGSCDLGIDLGAQDPANYGVFPNATVWLRGSSVANTTGKPFPAVAVAGQLAVAGQPNGKFAIFLIGFDSAEPWGIYLLQSN